MKGTRIEPDNGKVTPKPGEYGKLVIKSGEFGGQPKDHWFCCPPGGTAPIDLKFHAVHEYHDGTISVSPVIRDGEQRWFLERGEWRQY